MKETIEPVDPVVVFIAAWLRRVVGLGTSSREAIGTVECAGNMY